MLNVLWVEDDKDNIDEYTDDSFEKLFGTPIVPTSFKESYEYTKNNLAYDFVIIDIDLNKFPDFNEEFTNTIKNDVLFERFENKNKTFAQVAGFSIYAQLLESGFPKNRVIFLTANAGSQNNTYSEFEKHFTQALMPLPDYIIKDDNAPEKLIEKLKLKIDAYLVLRRGIIEGCKEAKNSKLYFNEFIKDKDNNAQPEDIENYLISLENFLPLRKPEKEKDLYKFFVRTLSHEWEAANNIRPDRENKKDLAWIMKNTRRWMAHNSKLFSELNEKIVAYLFMINLRVMFNFEDEKLKSYEQILLELFKEELLDELEIKNILNKVNEAYIDIKELISQENSNGIVIEDGFYFNELVNNIQLSKSSRKDDKELFTKLLYQMFWLITCNPRTDKLEIKFWEFKYSKKPYLFELARHIYHRSFS